MGLFSRKNYQNSFRWFFIKIGFSCKAEKNTQIDVEHGESEMCFILLCSEDIYEWTELGIIQRVSRSLSGIISHNVSASTEENRTSILGKR